MSKKEQSFAAKAYLTLYNAVQAASWAFILAKTLLYFSEKKCYKGVFENVEWELGLAQTAGFLEVLHCVVGLVRSSPFLTFMQILSRVIVYWGILVLVPESRLQPGLPVMLVAWCIAEITRYLFYVLSLHNACPAFFTWCRYSFFLVLYPAGVTGELVAMYTALPYIKKNNVLTFDLPNKYNISFDYHLLVIVVMLSYIPAFPQLFGHMLKQRSKVLNPPKEKAQ